MTGSLEEMDQFRLHWVESNVFALGTHGDQRPRQMGPNTGWGLCWICHVLFLYLKKKKEEEEAEAKIAKCQHWSNLYGMYTEDILLAVLLYTLEIFRLF